MPALQPDFNDASWRVSKRCYDGGCVMVGHRDKSILVGDTAQLGGPYVTHSAAAWKNFLLSVKQGDFDRPA